MPRWGTSIFAMQTCVDLSVHLQHLLSLRHTPETPWKAP